LSEKLLLRLRTGQFLAVAGASGSGKSSLLRAGVIPKMRAEGWPMHLLTPTAHPLERLAQTLTRDISAYDLAGKVCADLQTNPRTLRQVVGKLVSQQDVASGVERLRFTHEREFWAQAGMGLKARL
jgi:energy-coupling factor transporter ATP-binding protein EcfA2